MTAATLLWLVLLCVGPVLVALALGIWPAWRRLLLAATVFWTCYVSKPFYQELFFEPYRGVDRGFGVTIADLLFLGMAVALAWGVDRRQRCWWPFNTASWVCLLVASTISLIGSPVGYYGLFSLHKLVRGYLLYWVIVNSVSDGDDLRAVLLALSVALLFQGGVVLWAKYVSRTVVNRSIGTFPHPNSLAMYINVVLPMLLALLLAGRLYRRDEPLVVIALLAGVVGVLFSKSRGSLVLMGLALAVTTLISLLQRVNSRKLVLLACALAVATVLGLAAAPKLIERFAKAPKASEETREYFNAAALAMWSDHPLGTGLNSYAWMLANTDYYWLVYPDQVDVADPVAFRESKNGQSRLGTCHHIYLLWAAETGWGGLIAFVVLIMRSLLRAIVVLSSTRDEALRALLLGGCVGLATLHLQGLLEWVFRQTQVFYLYCIVSGLLVACERVARGAR